MKRLRLVVLIAGILVAGLAFNSVAQGYPKRAKMMSKREVKAYKDTRKNKRAVKAYNKRYKGQKAKAKHVFDKDRKRHKGKSWAS